MLDFLKIAGVVVLLFFIAPVAVNAALYLSRDNPGSWRDADWSSAAILPAPADEPQASIRVMAARTGGYKGILAVHTWIVLKPEGAARYRRYDVVGWGNPVRRDAYPADGRWYSNRPRIIHEVTGDEAARLIPKVEAAIADYRWSARGSYRIWPGPNSNTFTATILAAVPELGADVPPTAIGRDYRTGFFRTGSGWSASLGGVAGLTLGRREGIQFSLFGLVAGIRFSPAALILPGFGAMGMATDL